MILRTTFFLLLLAALLPRSVLRAQQSILSPADINVADLTQEQSSRYHKLLALQAHRNYQFIRVQNLAEYQQQGRIAASFTHAPCSRLVFRADDVAYEGSDSTYYWYGQLVYEDSSQECSYGTAMLLARRGEHFGQLQVGTRTYDLTDLSGGLQLIAEEKTNTAEGPVCAAAHTARRASGGPEADPNGFCKVRVLVLYTASAKAEDPNIDNRIDLAFAQTRQALTNSLIDPGYLDLVHAGSVGVEFSEDSYYLEEDLRNMSSYNPVSGNASEVMRYRSRYQADIVVLLTKPTNGGLKGIVTSIQNRDTPYAAMQMDWATNSSYTFAHEIGHILGARHQDGEGRGKDDTPSIAHAHQFTFSTVAGTWPFRKTYINTQRTLTYGDTRDNGEAVLHWSSPVVSYRGTATGTNSSPAGARNAAQHIRNVACTVAGNFAQEPGDFSVATNMEGACPGRPSVVRAHVSGPSYYPPAGTYTYEWAQSSDGISYGPVIGTLPHLNFTMPPETAKIFFRVKVTQPGGAVQYGYRSTRPMPPPMCGGRFATEQEAGIPPFLSVSPQPATSQALLRFSLPQAASADICLYDGSGRSVRTVFSGKAEAGVQTIALDLQDIAAGVYYIRLRSNAYTGTCPLIIAP